MGCAKCENETIHGHGLCQKCYNKEYNKSHRNKINEQHRERAYITTSRKPMDKNKKCTLFLGVHIAENILSKTFKNVKRMPNNTPWYDFICDKGKKIDVKSSCARINKLGRRTWGFRIKNNTVADYFLCLIFDNRNDLNPLHIWLIPGGVFSKYTGVTISESTLQKWKEYELDINTTIQCCNTMKQKSKENTDNEHNTQ